MASKRRLRRRGCEGKKRHATQQDAVGHLRWLARLRVDTKAGNLNAYHCQFCKGWHVGHLSPKLKA